MTTPKSQIRVCKPLVPCFAFDDARELAVGVVVPASDPHDHYPRTRIHLVVQFKDAEAIALTPAAAEFLMDQLDAAIAVARASMSPELAAQDRADIQAMLIAAGGTLADDSTQDGAA